MNLPQLEHATNRAILNVSQHTFTVWAGENFDSRWSNWHAAARRALFLGKGALILDEASGQSSGWQDICAFKNNSAGQK